MPSRSLDALMPVTAVLELAERTRTVLTQFNRTGPGGR